MRLLVVGASGQVGGAVLRAAEARGDTTLGGFVSRPPALPESRTARIDKSDATTIGPGLDRLRPDWIVDTGALHNVDYCEGHPAEALAVNRDGTGELARAARERGAGFLFVSTDFVFDGGGHPPYREEDPARPLSTYGRSKLEGEAAAVAHHPDSIVVRPSVVYSWVPPSRRAASASQKPVNFGSWAIDQLRGGKEIRIVRDQVASPTLAEDLADALLGIIDHRARGIWHAAGATAIDRYTFTVRIAETLGFATHLVVPITTDSLHQVARRPPNSSLDSSRLAGASGHAMLDLPHAMGRLAEAWRTSPPV